MNSGRCVVVSGSLGVNGRSVSVNMHPAVSLEAYWRRFRPIPGPWWYKITIFHGGRYSKEYVLGTLLASVAPASFIPLSYAVCGADATFFVDDSEAAAMLAQIDDQITTSNGHKLQLAVGVKPRSPHMELNSAVKEIITATMGKRFEPTSKALDLSQFHTYPDLRENCAVALFSPEIMTTVLDIIMESVLDLRALDLSHSNLSVLDSLVVLALRFPNLRVLHIGRNLFCALLADTEHG